MSDKEWTTVSQDQSKMIRWTEKPKNDWEKDNTIFVSDTIEGLYTSRRDNVGKNDATIYEVKVGDELYAFWDTTVLADKMSQVPLNSEINVKMTGMVKSKSTGKEYAAFEVKHRPAPMVEVGKKDDVPFVS